MGKNCLELLALTPDSVCRSPLWGPLVGSRRTGGAQSLYRSIVRSGASAVKGGGDGNTRRAGIYTIVLNRLVYYNRRGMREITPQLLWIGNARDVRDIRRLHDVGVAAVVDLAYEETCAQLSRDMLYCRFPLLDGAENSPSLLAAAVTTTASLIRGEIPTLVACSAGMSRSPSILAAAFSVVCGKSPDECLHQLIDGHPHDISAPLWNDVVKAFEELEK